MSLKKIKYTLFLLVLLLLSNNVVRGQNLYKIQYDLTLSNFTSANTSIPATYTLRLQQGGNSFLYYSETVPVNGIPKVQERDEVVNLNFNPTTISQFSSGPPQFQGGTPCTNNQVTSPYNNPQCNFFPMTPNNCPIPSNDGAIVMWRIENLESLNTSSGDTMLLSCQPRDIFLASCTSLFFNYMVEYQIGDNTSSWTTLLPYGSRNTTFQIQESDFPGITHNTTVRLRVSYDQSNTNASRQIIPLTFIKCSPEIENIFVENPMCSYNDGSFMVTFSRALDVGEQLVNIGVYKDDGDGILEILNGEDVFSQPNPNNASYTGTTFTYPENLAPGVYFFRYQSTNAAGAPNSDIFSPSFEIIAPPPLEYAIEVTTDLDCFDSNDGAVTITINPNNNGSIGTPFYAYTINNGTLVSFTGPSVTLSNLGPGSLQFKVFDSNNCTERQ